MKVITASCDWKSPQELIQELTDRLPELGLFAWQPETGSDCFQILVSNQLPTEHQKEQIEDYLHENGDLDELEKWVKL